MKALILVAAFAGAATLSGQTFRVGVDAVRVDVLVTEGNRPVGGLTAADFEVRDRDVVQQIESVSFEDVPLNVMLVLDTSSSVAGTPLDHLKQAASAVVELLTPSDRGSLLTFSQDLRLLTPWTSDRAALLEGIKATAADGGTGLHDAAYAALTLRDSTPGRPLVLIFSDGDDTLSWLPGSAVIEIGRRNDAVVYAVGLKTSTMPLAGYRVDFSSGMQAPTARVVPQLLMEPFLSALADDTGGKYIGADRSDALRDTFVRIMNEFRTRYLVTYIPRGVQPAGWHPIEVKVKGRRARVTARKGYLK
jgi:VWFA-related protein